jgi:hypothetical protein
VSNVIYLSRPQRTAHRELAKLQRERSKDQSRIKQLEIEGRQREVVLKRKMEENSMLLQKRHKLEAARPGAPGKER